MKRIVAAALMVLSLLGLGWAAYETAAPLGPELSHFIPPGALLYLEAKDFSSLLSDWHKSSEKEKWLKSRNYDVFEKSRLLLRLKDTGEEFSSAAGVPANANLLGQVAGKQAALALYDIGKLQFLYITRLSSTDATQSLLWQSRSKFETRSVGNVSFFYRSDPDSGREVAFAITGDYLLLSTREDLMAGALQLISGAKTNSMEKESWWERPVREAGAPGDLRMVVDLEKIVPSPYFRSYWVQRNIGDMKQYSTAVSDLTRSGGEFREERVLLKKDPAAQNSSAEKGSFAVAELLRLVPADTGYYEARANPNPKDSLDLLTVKILAPHLGPAAVEKLAPRVQLGNGEIGSNSDFETRIDEAPSQNRVSRDNRTALENAFSLHEVLARLQIQGTERDEREFFVRIHSAVAFESETNWDEQEIHSALAEFVRPGFTTGQLGVEWKTASGYSTLNGLWPLSVAVRGKYLIISDNAALLNRVLANLNRKVAEPAVFAAGFDHQAERKSFLTLTGLLDAGRRSAGPGESPEFFSENIASLSFVLEDVISEKIVIRDAADRQRQTVTYRWAR